MNAAEYERLDRAERDHWWFRGLRGLLAQLLRTSLPADPAPTSILDAGCGTGGNLQLIAEQLHPRHLAGFDLSDDAVLRAREKNPGADVYRSDLTRPELRHAPYELVLCCDVLYATGLGPARDGLAALRDSLAPGGALLLHVPAYQWLYSAHDAAVHTRERFTLGQIRDLLASLELQIETLTYRLSLLFPLVVLRRLPDLLGLRAVGRDEAVSDLSIPSGPVNRLLLSIVTFENWLIARGIRFPFGCSIVAVGRKPLAGEIAAPAFVSVPTPAPENAT